MVTLIRQGGQYDGLSASGDATVRLITDGLVSAVDVEKLFPEWKNFWEPMKSPVHNTIDGVHYGISHGWGANILMWNTEEVTTEPTSWGAVFETDPLPEEAFLLDVREPAEFDAGHVPGATNIPLGELRARLDELPDPALGREVVLYCGVGQRAYNATRALVQRGHRVRNLSGGFATWRHVQAARGADQPAPNRRDGG